MYRGTWRNLPVAVKTVVFQVGAAACLPPARPHARLHSPAGSDACLSLAAWATLVDGPSSLSSPLSPNPPALQVRPCTPQRKRTSASASSATAVQDRACGKEKAHKRAITEAAITSSVSHPNVVATLSYDVQPLAARTGGAAAAGGGGGGGFTVSGVGGAAPEVTDWCALGAGALGAAAPPAGALQRQLAAHLPLPCTNPSLTPCASPHRAAPAGSCCWCSSSAAAAFVSPSTPLS